jgi:hypothetical protein
MRFTNALRAAFVFSLATLAFSFPVHAAVNVFFSAGNNCSGAPNALFTPGGPAVPVTLCMTTTAPTATCGHTIVLQSAAMESGRFTVVAPFTLGANYNDPNTEVPPLPLAINNPPLVADLGGTSSSAVSAAANQVLATFNLSPAVSATNNSYVISLAPVSAVAVDADGTCGQTTVPSEQAISASFTLNKNPAPVFTSANAVTFATGAANTFTVVASGTPAPTLSVSGALPSGVSFTPATGALAGMPSTPGTFPLTFTATNASGSVMQSFTLTVSGQASQTITFNNPGTQTFGSTPLTLVASASSGLPVTLSSATPFVCTVSGTSLTMVATGTCTVNANQAGNATFAAAPQVTQSFGIIATVPGAPTIGAATAGNTTASIAFTAPASTGGSPIQSFTVTCNGISASGNSSPITVTGLTNGTMYSCTVTATNALGSGPASGAVSVTPTAGAALQVVSVQSRKTHGSTGTFDLAIQTGVPIGGSVTVEPRLIGAGHQVVFEFNSPITSLGGVSTVDSASATGIGSPMATFSGNEVTVTLTGSVLENKRLTVQLTGVNGTLDTSVSLGFLVGDVNNSRSVTSADILPAKARSGLTTDLSNFIFDINANGSITSADILQIKGRSGSLLNP